MSNSRIYFGLSKPWRFLSLKIFTDLDTSCIHIDDDKQFITIINPQENNIQWKRFFDVLEAKGIILGHCNYCYDYESKSDWKTRQLERDGVLGAILDWYDSLDLRNPVDQLALRIPGVDRGFLPRHYPPMVSRRPKKLIAIAEWEVMFSREICNFLRNNGAEFETGPVLYKRQPLDDWYKIYPNHNVDFISPDCFTDFIQYPDSPNTIPGISTYGVMIADNSLDFCFALDNQKHGAMGNELNFVINLELLNKMLETFPKAHEYLTPIFSAEGWVGQLFYDIMARAMPLMEPSRKPPVDWLKEYAAKFGKPTKYEPLEKEPAEELHIKPQPVLGAMHEPRFRYELLEEECMTGGVGLRERDLSCLLCDSGQLPELAWQAPVASWILARLCAEAKTKRELPEYQGADGGEFWLSFVAHEESGDIVAGATLSGGTYGASLSVHCREGLNPQDVIDDFIALLLSNPMKLAKCCIRVYDPEWHETPDSPDDYEPTPKRSSRNKYGWDGKKFLGADNIWDSSTAHHERPDRYEEYLRANYRRWKEAKTAK